MKLNDKAISQYVETIQNLFKLRSFEGRWLVVTPFIRPTGEYIELELIPQDDKVLITDNCSTVDYLFVNGVNVEAQDFKVLLPLIAKGFGIEISGEEVRSIANIDHFGYELHKVLSALLGISFLIYRRRLLQPTELRVRKKFPTLVRDSLSKIRGVTYQQRDVRGKFITHTFPFCVSVDKGAESLLYPLTANSENEALREAMILAFRWIDIKEGGNRYRKITVIDDVDMRKATYWENGPKRLLIEFSDSVVLWSRRELLEQVLRS